MTTTTPCSIVRTESLDLLLAAGPCVIARNGIILVDGPAGCGKTTAVRELTGPYGDTVAFVSLEPRSSDKNVAEQVYRAVADPTALTSPSRRTDLLFRMRYLLAGPTRVLVIDEGQNAGISALEMIRHLHMEPSSDFALILSGAGLSPKVAREPMLNNRIDLRVFFTPLTGDALVKALAGIHPVFAHTDPSLLEAADREMCRGVLRHWHKTLLWLLELGASESNPPTRQALEQALTFISGRAVRLKP